MSEYEKNLMEQFVRAVMLLFRYEHHSGSRRAGRFSDTSRGQGRVLSVLMLKPEISQKELAYLLDMRNQSLGELLTKLERNGLITRSPLETDRRVMNIKLTQEGRKAAEAAQEQQDATCKLFECLSEEEQKTLNELLQKVIQEMEQQMGVDSRMYRRNFEEFKSGHFRGSFDFRAGDMDPEGFFNR